MSFDDRGGLFDDETGNRDQGLEIVVIPYRPSPPPKPPRPPSRKKKSGVTALPSPASDETKECDSDGGVLSPPPPPNRDNLFTPRSRSAMAEAEGHDETATPPPPAKGSLKSAESMALTGGAKDDDAKSSNNVKAAPERSHSVGPTATSRSHSNAAASSNKASARYKHSNSEPPRVRSKSTPPVATKKPKNYREKYGKKPTLYQMAKIGYQELCNAIIRPPRSKYPLEALGPEEFVFCGEKFVRKDFGVVNERGLLLECSMWKRVYDDDEEEEEDTLGDVRSPAQTRDDGATGGNKACGQITLNVDDWDESKESGKMYLQVPESLEEESLTSSLNDDSDGMDELRGRQSSSDDSQQDPAIRMMNLRLQHSERSAHTYYRGSTKTRKRRRQPVVIYLHGNSSARTEVVPQLGHLLSLGVSVVSFDFAGSGRSEGDYVSLGFYEREDLQTVIHHLRASGDVSTIGLWGRSMGAATAIMYGSRDPTISAMVVDSSFTDLTSLAEEMVERGKEQGVNVPNFVVSVALKMIKNSIKTQAGFSIRHLSPISHVNRCFIPALFVAGEHDQFINNRHTKQLYASYAGDKNIVMVDGGHNAPRPRFLLQSACLFLQSCMNLPPSSELVVPLGTNLLAPPWISPSFNRMGLGAAIAKARAGKSVSASAPPRSGERDWLPANDDRGLQRVQSPRKSLDGNALDRGEDIPPGLPLNADTRSRSCTDAAVSPTGADFLAPPDMSERQKEIQGSLFKMLGQHEKSNDE
ncbi:hypothetical protein ACHAXT_006633 [Thalassiosira profunda]